MIENGAHVKPTWQKIAAQLSQERDSEKVLQLSRELMRALDERDKDKRRAATEQKK